FQFLRHHFHSRPKSCEVPCTRRIRQRVEFPDYIVDREGLHLLGHSHHAAINPSLPPLIRVLVGCSHADFCRWRQFSVVVQRELEFLGHQSLDFRSHARIAISVQKVAAVAKVYAPSIMLFCQSRLCTNSIKPPLARRRRRRRCVPRRHALVLCSDQSHWVSREFFQCFWLVLHLRETIKNFLKWLIQAEYGDGEFSQMRHAESLCLSHPFRQGCVFHALTLGNVPQIFRSRRCVRHPDHDSFIEPAWSIDDPSA